jgi:Spy/CpxP family protein refolding chaperone
MSLTHRTALGALIGLLLLWGASPLSAQGKFKWWQSERYKTELMLTVEQVRRLEEVFQHALPTLRAQMKTLDAAETELERLVQRGETARAELNTSRTLMLLKMRRALTTDQWVKFGALHQALEREREQALQRSNAAPK